MLDTKYPIAEFEIPVDISLSGTVHKSKALRLLNKIHYGKETIPLSVECSKEHQQCHAKFFRGNIAKLTVYLFSDGETAIKENPVV